jgi:hypothetical protein
MPYKDPYREYLRQYEKRMNQGERIRKLHREWRKNNREKVREQWRKGRIKFIENNPELAKKQYIARKIAEKIPMKSYCELCPEEDNQGRKLSRHHLDYDYPEIFMTICYECHTWTRIINSLSFSK